MNLNKIVPSCDFTSVGLTEFDNLDPHHLLSVFSRSIGIEREKVLICGTIENRYAIAQNGNHGFFQQLTGDVRNLPGSVKDYCQISNDEKGRLSKTFTYLEWPVAHKSFLLVSLYEREIFPSFRFPLSISTVARAIRFVGPHQVRLLDLQFEDLPAVQSELSGNQHDVVGISATFGQFNLLRKTIEMIRERSSESEIWVGGSLGALSKVEISRLYPDVKICAGTGEQFVEDYLGVNVTDALHKGAVMPVFGAKKHDGLSDKYVSAPEFDLIVPSLKAGASLQCESSRGCFAACTFCPRQHKRGWRDVSKSLNLTLPVFSTVLRSFRPDVKKVHLVDEEFFGPSLTSDRIDRAKGIADIFEGLGLEFESSARVASVVSYTDDGEIAEETVDAIRVLQNGSFRRCLFGIESGVDSILDRYGKGATSRQNESLIRLLSGMGVKTRFTYITFDPLMDWGELEATFHFLNRDDLLLRTDTGEQDIMSAVSSGNVHNLLTGEPFYREVTYPLVSMECLEGAKYSRMASDAGLLGEFDPNMGRYYCRYRDPRIEVLARGSQFWIDRNFAFDYYLKGLAKKSNDRTSRLIYDIRKVFRTSAHELLDEGMRIARANFTEFGVSEITAETRLDKTELDSLITTFLDRVAERKLAELRIRIAAPMEELSRTLESSGLEHLRDNHLLWITPRAWRLIND